MQSSQPMPAPPRKRRRIVRWAVLALIFAALCAALLPLAARRMIGPDRLRGVAEQALTDALGRRVRIHGDVSIMLAPWFGLAMGPVTVADAPGFGDDPMFAARRLEMTIRVLPLLARVVSPGSVRLIDLEAHLRRDASGRTNWDDLTAPRDASAAAPPGWRVAPEPRDVLVENASVDYGDAQSGRHLAVSGVRLKTGLGQPFDFSLAFAAEGVLPDSRLECHVRGRASLDAASGGLTLHKTLVESGLVVSRPLAPGGATPTRVAARATAEYDPAAGVLTLSDLDARAPGARLAGTVRLTGLAEAPTAFLALSATVDTSGPWREILGLSPGRAGASLVSATDTPESSPSPPAASDTVLSAAGTERAEAGIEATADLSGLRVSSLRLRLPRGAIAATGSWRRGERPALDAAVTVEEVDFSRLPLPAGRSSWPWPASWLAGLDLDARLELRRCSLGPLAVTDGHATAVSRGGNLRLYPVSAVLPGGVVSLDVRLNPAPDGAGLDADARAVLEPLPAGPAGTKTATRANVTARLDATGAKGTFQAQSPNPLAAAKLLGQPASLPASPLEGRGAFTLAPGDDRLPLRVSLSDLEARFGGTTFRGQIGWDAAAEARLSFDLAADTLDLDQPPPLPAGGDRPGGARTEGKLRVDRAVLRGVEARNVALGLAGGGGRLEGTIGGAEIFGGRLSGRFESEPSGRLTASLQLAGAEASRLPGAGLAGAVTVKANLEAFGGAKGKPAPLAATVEAEAAQLVLGRGQQRHILASPKAVLKLSGHEAPEGTDSVDLDATLTVAAASAAELRDVRLAATGPVVLDKSGRPKESGPFKTEASALWRPTGKSGREVRLSLAGPLAVEAAGGGFTAGDLRLDAGGLAGTARIWRASGENAVSFSLATGSLAPRPILSAWGLPAPETIPADLLTRATLSVSGSAGEDSLDLKRLAVAVDDVTLTGHATLPRHDPKRGKWDLSLDRLDCDAYFPHRPSSGPPSLAERRKPLDLSFLRELAMDLTVRFGWLKKGNVTFDATTITANARGGLFTFRQESPRFYGGRFFAEIRGDAREAALKTFIELKLEGFECARFLKDWAEGDTLSSGGATFILAARTSGANEEELRGNLAGNASLQITRGDLKVRESAGKPGEPASQDRLPFDVFSSSWFARGGVARSEDFRIDGPRMRVSGKGSVDLRDESISLAVTASLPDGGQVPATIIGPLDNPKLTIDRSRLLGDMVYRVLQGIVSIPGKAVTRILQVR